MGTRPFTGTIVSTKLTPPSQHETLLERPQLTGRIADRLNRRLTIIRAPAGYGKTSLLVQACRLVQMKGGMTAWLSLDANDDDLVPFIRYFIAAIQSTGIAFGQATASLLKTGFELPPEIIQTTILNELANISDEVYIFLDDFHVISNPVLLESIHSILLSPLKRVHFIITARNSAVLPTARMRVMGELHEIGAADLKFSEHETRHYFDVSGGQLRPEQVTLLYERTEGWIAGLQLAMLAIVDQEDSTKLLENLSGERHSVGEFLAAEVFRRQPEDVRVFLLGSAIFKRFDARLCNSLLQCDDSQAMLERIADASLFIFSLDTSRQWFRYHHLFAEFLNRQLRDAKPAEWAVLQRRASDALVAGGHPIEAIDHALIAGDMERTAELLDAASQHLFATGQTAILRSHAAKLPADVLEKLPRLQLELAWEAEVRWDFASARAALDNVRDAVDRHDSGKDGQKSLRRLRSELAHREMMLSVFSDDLPRADRRAQRWMEGHDSGDLFMRASVGTTRLLCARELHVCDIGSHDHAYLHELFLEARGTYLAVFHDSLSGVAFFARGELDAAENIYRGALKNAELLHGAGSALAAMPALLLAELAYERSDLAQVRALLDVYPMASTTLGFVDNLIPSFVIRSRIAVMDGDTAGAWDILRAGRSLAERFGFHRLRAAIAGEQARQLALGGRGGEIRDLLEDAGLSPAAMKQDAPFSLMLDVAVARARAAATPAEMVMAMAALRELSEQGRRRNCFRGAVRASLHLALLAVRQEKFEPHRHHLFQSLRLAGESGMKRLFLDEGAPLMALLQAMLAGEDGEPGLVRFATELLDRDLAPFAKGASDDFPIGSEPLSVRELDVIRMGLDSRTTEESARVLGLSESTIKWYWQRVFQKLDVHRRSDAIRKVRQLGLL